MRQTQISLTVSRHEIHQDLTTFPDLPTSAAVNRRWKRDGAKISGKTKSNLDILKQTVVDRVAGIAKLPAERVVPSLNLRLTALSFIMPLPQSTGDK
jgi:hypothetical protein